MGIFPLVLLIDFLNAGGDNIGPFLILHFFWIFPHEFNFAKKKSVNYILYLLPAVMLIGLMIYRFLFVYDMPGRTAHYENFYVITNIGLGIAFLAGFISLLVNYFRLKTAMERKPLSLILIAYFLTILVIVYYQVYCSRYQ